ncbi:MAG: NAD(P)/FAD-dependent oxidoreductase [Candidatus Hodgkinia cicadicola]
MVDNVSNAVRAADVVVDSTTAKPTTLAMNQMETKVNVEGSSAERRAERLVIIGSGLAGYSAAIAACSHSPLLITGSVLGGRLAGAESLDYWPGAVSDAKGSDLANSLHAQGTRLGVRFMNDVVKSIDTSSHPHVISTERNGSIVASAIIVATGLTPKVLGLAEESALLGRGVFTSSSESIGQHQTVAVVGDGDYAASEALKLAQTSEHVNIICSVNNLSCSAVLASKLAIVPNIKVECSASVLSYVTDLSEGSVVLKGLALQRGEETFSVGATAVVLAVGYEPKCNLLPEEVKTAEGYVKVKAGNHALGGIFCAGSIVEGTPDQAIMTSASGFVAAQAAVSFIKAEVACERFRQVIGEKIVRVKSALSQAFANADLIEGFGSRCAPSKVKGRTKKGAPSKVKGRTKKGAPSKVKGRTKERPLSMLMEAHAKLQSLLMLPFNTDLPPQSGRLLRVNL